MVVTKISAKKINIAGITPELKNEDLNKQKVCLSASLEEQPLIVNAGNNKNTKQNMKNTFRIFFGKHDR